MPYGVVKTEEQYRIRPAPGAKGRDHFDGEDENETIETNADSQDQQLKPSERQISSKTAEALKRKKKDALRL